MVGLENLGSFFKVYSDIARGRTGERMRVGEALGIYWGFAFVAWLLQFVIGTIAELTQLGIDTIRSPFGIAMLVYMPNTGVFGVFSLFIGEFIMFFVIVPIAMFILAIIYHIMGKAIAGFHGGFSGTLVGVAYQTMTILGLIWLVFIPYGVIALFGVFAFSVYVLVNSWSLQHRTARTRSLLVWFALTAAVALLLFIAYQDLSYYLNTLRRF